MIYKLYLTNWCETNEDCLCARLVSYLEANEAQKANSLYRVVVRLPYATTICIFSNIRRMLLKEVRLRKLPLKEQRLT